MENISVGEAKSRLDTEQNIVLLDVRENWEYEICHIDGSIHIPMGEIPARVKELEQDKIIFVVCHHGSRSLQVAAYLESNGYQQVVNLAGGINDWALEVDETMARY